MIIGGLFLLAGAALVFYGWVMTFQDGWFFVPRLMNAIGWSIIAPGAFLGGALHHIFNNNGVLTSGAFWQGVMLAIVPSWLAVHHWARLNWNEGDSPPQESEEQQRWEAERMVRANERRARLADLEGSGGRKWLFAIGLSYPIWAVFLMMRPPLEPLMRGFGRFFSTTFPPEISPYAGMICYWIPWFLIVWAFFSGKARSDSPDEPDF